MHRAMDQPLRASACRLVSYGLFLELERDSWLLANPNCWCALQEADSAHARGDRVGAARALRLGLDAQALLTGTAERCRLLAAKEAARQAKRADLPIAVDQPHLIGLNHAHPILRSVLCAAASSSAAEEFTLALNAEKDVREVERDVFAAERGQNLFRHG
eukprot:m.429166 g.429166  ORF g.429166 m.429166 type:complete len:160 (+) comp16970_c0_seq1:58-537(+)